MSKHETGLLFWMALALGVGAVVLGGLWAVQGAAIGIAVALMLAFASGMLLMLWLVEPVAKLDFEWDELFDVNPLD